MVCVSLCSVSCKKEKGLDGVNGKDGKDGVDGKDGANGKDGTNGKDGKNADVRSKVYTITNWSYDSEYMGYFSALEVSSFITPTIKSSGIVLVYAQSPNQVANNSWSLLPHIIFQTSSYFSLVTYAMSSNTQTVTVWWYDSDKLRPDTPSHLNIRVVAIPGSLVNSSSTVNFKDYDMVLKTFNLK